MVLALWIIAICLVILVAIIIAPVIAEDLSQPDGGCLGMIGSFLLFIAIIAFLIWYFF